MPLGKWKNPWGQVIDKVVRREREAQKAQKKKNNNNKTERPSTFSSQVYALVASVADGVKYVIWGRKLGRLKDKCLF